MPGRSVRHRDFSLHEATVAEPKQALTNYCNFAGSFGNTMRSTDHCVNDGECIALIDAPLDCRIYTAFRAVARKYRESVESQSLWLERDVPITPDLTAATPSRLLFRLFDGAQSIIARIELVVAGLRVEFVRSGGHPPFPESFFDELHLSIGRQIERAKLESIVAMLFASLSVKVVTATGVFAPLLHVTPGTMESLRLELPSSAATGKSETL